MFKKIVITPKALRLVALAGLSLFFNCSQPSANAPNETKAKTPPVETVYQAERTVDCPLGAITDEVVKTYGEKLTGKLSRAKRAGINADLPAKQLRKQPGRTSISGEVFDSKTLLRGTESNAGLVPKEIAQALNGKEFKNFDAFRKEFWKTVGDSKYAKDFSLKDQLKMKAGYSPQVTIGSQNLGARRVYELHHITPIRAGGNVYDLSNIMITTPKFHKEVLKRTYHYGH